MTRLFGTDGVRGPAGEGALAPEALLALGRAVAAVARAGHDADSPPLRALLGRDGRPSGPMTAGALAAGLQAGGVSVEDGGVLPTPAVALLVRLRRFHLGAAVSASHNPASDDGVKLLGPDGEKVPDTFERAVERGLARARRARGSVRGGPAPGKIRPGAAEEYIDAVLGEFRGLRLKGLRVVVDGADGAASGTAPEVLRRLGPSIDGIAVRKAGCVPRPAARASSGTRRTGRQLCAEAAAAETPAQRKCTAAGLSRPS